VNNTRDKPDVIEANARQDWIPASAGMTILLSLIDTLRHGFARHPGERRDPSLVMARTTLNNARKNDNPKIIQ